MLCNPKKDLGTWDFSPVFLFYNTLGTNQMSSSQQLTATNIGEAPSSFPLKKKKMATIILK